MGKKESANIWMITTIVLAILLVATIVAIAVPKSSPLGTSGIGSGTVTVSDDIKQKNKVLADDDPVQGDKNAPIVMVEFSDFQCPFCGKFYQETLPSIEKEYIQTGKVQLVFRDFPLSFHENAQNAAEAAECANEQGKFWQMHNKLYENQQAIAATDLKQYASDLGLDVKKFNDCFDSAKYAAEIQKDEADGQANGISGTPGFLINGQLISGAMPYENFKAVFESILTGKPVQAAGQPTDAQPQLADTTNDPAIALVIVNDNNCKACDTSQIMQVTGKLFPTAKSRTVQFDSDEGKKLVKELNLNALPAYLFDEAVTKGANYNKVANAIQKTGNYYMIDPAATGAAKYLNPPTVDDDPMEGDKNAKVTIIEFSDFQCPFCGKFYSDAYKQIDEQYIKTGKVKLVFRDFPLSFHQNAHPAAEAAECANEQGKFWEMHNKLFENQQALAVTDLKQYAADLKLDVKKFNDCFDSGKYKAEIDKDAADGGKVGVSGTPAFFINGIALTGAQPFSAFKEVIDAELAK